MASRDVRRALIGLILLTLSPIHAKAAEPYTVDVMLPLTGAAAFAGQAQQLVVRMYERLVNKTGGIHGQPLRFEIHDDQSNPVIAVQIVNELLPKKPVVILGPSVAATCSAVSPLLAKGQGPVNYCFSPVAVPPRGGYVFAATQSAQALIPTEVSHLQALGYRRAALLVATDASGQANAELFDATLGVGANQAIKLVAEERFSPTAIGIAAQVARIKAANPDLVLVWANGTAFLMTLRELKNAGLDVPVVTNPFNADGDLLRKNQGLLPTTLFVQGLPYQGRSSRPALRAAGAEYVAAFRDAGLKPTSIIQAYCWDPIKIAITALRALPANATASQLHDYLENLHDFPGLFGLYDFRGGDNYGLSGEDTPFVRWDAARDDWVPL
jgi:branched-chain amino acid transport system substrate-binding protein